MADRSRKQPKRPRDTNVRAASTVARATHQEPEEDEEEAIQVPEPTPEERHAAAVALGRLGGKKGGKARAAKLTPEQRSESARKAARARWSKPD
jgi:hypothetical protein